MKTYDRDEVAEALGTTLDEFREGSFREDFEDHVFWVREDIGVAVMQDFLGYQIHKRGDDGGNVDGYGTWQWGPASSHGGGFS